MARLLLVALIGYAVMDFSDLLPRDMTTFDDEDEAAVVSTSNPADPRASKFATASTPSRWTGAIQAIRIQAHDRLAVRDHLSKRLPPPLRPRHVAALRPLDASADH